MNQHAFINSQALFKTNHNKEVILHNNVQHAWHWNQALRKGRVNHLTIFKQTLQDNIHAAIICITSDDSVSVIRLQESKLLMSAKYINLH